MDVYTLLQTQHTCGTPRDDTTCARKPSMKCTGDRAEVAATPRLRKQANQGSHRRAVHPGTPQSPSPLGNTGDGCLCTRPQRPATTQSPGMGLRRPRQCKFAPSRRRRDKKTTFVGQILIAHIHKLLWRPESSQDSTQELTSRAIFETLPDSTQSDGDSVCHIKTEVFEMQPRAFPDGEHALIVHCRVCVWMETSVHIRRASDRH